MIDGKTRDELIAAHRSSADILKPFLQGRDIRRWQVEPQDWWLIFAHRGIQIDSYPAILSYLEEYKGSLSKRGGEHEWYELQASIDEAESFVQTKLVCPHLYNTHTFALETDGFTVGTRASLSLLTRRGYVVYSIRALWSGSIRRCLNSYAWANLRHAVVI